MKVVESSGNQRKSVECNGKRPRVSTALRHVSLMHTTAHQSSLLITTCHYRSHRFTTCHCISTLTTAVQYCQRLPNKFHYLPTHITSITSITESPPTSTNARVTTPVAMTQGVCAAARPDLHQQNYTQNNT